LYLFFTATLIITYYDSYSITDSVSTTMANWLREQFCNLVYFTDFFLLKKSQHNIIYCSI